ncbi:hypothetical protein [Fulvivirga lutimaris]|uniref:hypothetical protein n=1 Tax=Fulvivirga lutimaris TaxID=1819566 RepID=UPI0016296CCC|nr:hypothetical protein [Fulvivirga lutimaris]
MKSKILIAAVAVAILGSFAFITIDKNSDNKIVASETQQQPMQGITMEDSNF